jgi:ariadne-1
MEINSNSHDKLCSVCEASEIELKFNCGKGLCQECITLHIKSQLEKYKTKVFCEKIKFVCCGSCKCPQSTEMVEKLMDENTQKIYYDLLLKMYLSKSGDILQCPRSSCSNYGFIKNTKFNIICKMTKCYECPACCYTWSDSPFTLNEIFNPNKNIFSTFSINNIKTVVKKYFLTKYCNYCSTPIEKAEGCIHMECNRCEYAFCWRCTEDWKTHKEFVCMGLLTNEYDESFRVDFTIQVLYFLIFWFILKFLFTFTIIFYLAWLIIKMGIFCGLLFIDLFFVYGGFHCLLKFKKKFKSIIIFLIIALFEIMCYVYNLHPFSEKVYLYFQAFTIPIFVICMTVTGGFLR